MTDQELNQGEMIYSLPRRKEKDRELEFDPKYRDVGVLLCKYTYTQKELKIFDRWIKDLNDNSKE